MARDRRWATVGDAGRRCSVVCSSRPRILQVDARPRKYWTDVEFRVYFKRFIWRGRYVPRSNFDLYDAYSRAVCTDTAEKNKGEERGPELWRSPLSLSHLTGCPFSAVLSVSSFREKKSRVIPRRGFLRFATFSPQGRKSTNILPLSFSRPPSRSSVFSSVQAKTTFASLLLSSFPFVPFLLILHPHSSYSSS